MESSFVSATGGTWAPELADLRRLQTGFSRAPRRGQYHPFLIGGWPSVFFPDQPGTENLSYSSGGAQRFYPLRFCGPLDSKGYRYYGPRAYADLVESELKSYESPVKSSYVLRGTRCR